MKTNYQKIEMRSLPMSVIRIVNEILEREGNKYTQHEHDWPTKYGIRRLSADRAGYEGNIRDLTRDEAARIWVSLFYYGPNFHLIMAESELVCSTVMDTSGPAGLKVGITHLQKALNSFNKLDHTGRNHIYGRDLDQDGIIGMKTIRMLQHYKSHRMDAGIHSLAVRLNCLQDAHYVEVALRIPKKRSFSFGWLTKRVESDLMALADDTEENFV